MSVACAVVVYRGGRVSKSKLTALLRRKAPTIGAVRHGDAEDLHWIVIVDDLRVHVSAKALATVNDQLPLDASLSAIVQAAWKLARPTAQLVLQRAAGPNRYETLARELSAITGTSWMIERSASKKVVGRRFDAGAEQGKTHSPASALGCERTELERLLRSACSTDADPPVLVMKQGARAVPFRRSDYERALH